MAKNAQLPPGWEARWNQSYGRYYFIDHSTQETTWTDPRLAVGARNNPPAEHIPMREFSYRQSSAQSQSTGQTSSTARTKETGFQFSIDPSSDDEDEEWRDALLRSTMENDKKKHLMFHEKINMKEKFKREFNELDGHAVENTVEKHDYDQDIIRATLESLKDAHIRKREAEERKRKEKEADEKRKAAERKKDMDRMKKELRAKRDADRKAELEAERRRSAAAAAAARQRASPTVSTVETRKISQTTQPKDTRPTRQKVEPKRAPAKTSTTPKLAGGKQVYISPNRLQPVGPQASLRKGPDRRHLVRQYSSASGANKALVSGPQRTNRKGPSAVQPKVSMSKGPQASLRQGPQCRLIHGQERPTITRHQSPFISAV